MGIKSEEVQIKNEIDELENEEININLEIYKLQKELNKRLPKKKRKKVKKNYEEIIRKWKLEKEKKLSQLIEAFSKNQMFQKD